MKENTLVYIDDEYSDACPEARARGEAGETANCKVMGYVLAVIIFGLFIICLAWISECSAPELTERDTFGYSPYRIAEDGGICDDQGVIKGWVRGDTVYDSQWNVRYRIRGNRLYRGEEDEG